MKDPARSENSLKGSDLGKRGNIKLNWLHVHSESINLRAHKILLCDARMKGSTNSSTESRL